MRVGVKTSIYPALSAEHQESTISQQEMTYPSILHTGQLPIMPVQHEETHYADTDVAASHIAN